MLDRLIERLNSIHPLQDDVAKRIISLVVIDEYPKKTLLLKEGQTANYVYFVLKGLARAYYYADEKEITSRFMDEGFVISSWISFYTRQPGNEYIETLEDTVVASFEYGVVQQLYAELIDFSIIGRKLTEHYLYLSEKRTKMLRKHSAEEKYKLFLEEHPSLIQRVPQKYIASYLGMNDETLSRVRAKMLKNQ
jgi:CRP-like cAMP-binding protein